jgi:hypothetical protein
LNRAFSDFEAALKLMHLMHQEPAGGSSSGSSRLASLTTSWAPRIAESIQDEPAELRRLAGILDQYEIKFDPRESLKVEFYQMLVSSRNFGQMLDPGNMPVHPSDTDVVPSPDPGVTGPPRGFMERVSMAAICEVFNNLMRMLDDQGDLREDWGDRASDYLDEVQDSERVSFMLASVQAGIIETVLQSIQKRAARFAATRSLIDVLIFRAENGRVPTSLDEAGALRMDPFTRDSLRAHLAEDEIRIWSLGIDKTDQNGVPTSSRGPRDDFVIWPSALSQKYYDDLYSED